MSELNVSTDQNTAILSRISEEVVRRRMSSPAVFVLEMYKPLIGLFREGVTVAAPLLYPLVGGKFYNAACEVLKSSDEVEKLIVAIEEQEDLIRGR